MNSKIDRLYRSEEYTEYLMKLLAIDMRIVEARITFAEIDFFEENVCLQLNCNPPLIKIGDHFPRKNLLFDVDEDRWLIEKLRKITGTSKSSVKCMEGKVVKVVTINLEDMIACAYGYPDGNKYYSAIKGFEPLKEEELMLYCAEDLDFYRRKRFKGFIQRHNLNKELDGYCK